MASFVPVCLVPPCHDELLRRRRARGDTSEEIKLTELLEPDWDTWPMKSNYPLRYVSTRCSLDETMFCLYQKLGMQAQIRAAS